MDFPKVVAIGGGTGLSTLLRGLKRRTDRNDRLTAIVTVADDGGSSGKLRESLNIPAPGDIRNCIVALSDEEEIMSRIFDYRFASAGELSGHSVGNILIAAATKVLDGNFATAVRVMDRILNVKGKVLPSTDENVVLVAHYDDGTTVTGESEIGKRKPPVRVELHPENAMPAEGVLEEIGEADLIVLGPGSLFTSIIPNLLIKGISDAINDSKAVKVYVCNIMTQPHETDGMAAEDHVEVIRRYVELDWIIVNNYIPTDALLLKYQREGAYPVVFDNERLTGMGINVYKDALAHAGVYLRHDPDKLAEAVLRVYAQGKGRLM